MTLYVVATPIGNLEDISRRAVRVLGEVDRIACEDTRQTRKLLTHLGLVKPLTSFFEKNEAVKTPWLTERLQMGESIALVTDAGTPAISDPGYRLVRAAVAAGVSVVPIPGPCAAVAALQASGLPTDRFLFAGFLPEKPGKREKTLEAYAPLPFTLVFYLSKWKALKQSEMMLKILGDRPVCLARELTKKFETFWRGSLEDLVSFLKAHPPKGELTLLVGPAGGKEA